MAYPSYSKFFSEIDGKCAMYFWKTYPSPPHLQGKTAEDLTAELKEIPFANIRNPEILSQYVWLDLEH